MSSRNAMDAFNKFDKWGKEIPVYDKEAIAKVTSLIPKDVNSILDLGCGDGRITNELLGFKRVIGLDFAKVALKYVKGECVLGSCTNLPFHRNSFDLMVITQVLEHLSDEGYEKTVKEIEELSPRYIIVGVPYKQDIRGLLCKCSNCGYTYLPSSNIGEHVRSFSEKKLASLFSYYIVDSISYAGKSRTDPLLRIRHLLGYYYTVAKYSPETCPRCGSSRQFSRRKGLFYRVISSVSWRIGRRRPVFIITRYIQCSQKD